MGISHHYTSLMSLKAGRFYRVPFMIYPVYLGVNGVHSYCPWVEDSLRDYTLAIRTNQRGPFYSRNGSAITPKQITEILQ